MVKNIEFRKIGNNFQQKVKDDIKDYLLIKSLYLLINQEIFIN